MKLLPDATVFAVIYPCACDFHTFLQIFALPDVLSPTPYHDSTSGSIAFACHLKLGRIHCAAYNMLLMGHSETSMAVLSALLGAVLVRDV